MRPSEGHSIDSEDVAEAEDTINDGLLLPHRNARQFLTIPYTIASSVKHQRILRCWTMDGPADWRIRRIFTFCIYSTIIQLSH